MEDKPSIMAAFLRVIVGAGFIALGVERFLRHDTAMDDLQRWGVPQPSAGVYVLGGIEVVCGVLLVLGLLPRLAALILAIEMVAAMFVAGRVDGVLYLLVPGLILIFLLILIGSGGGRWTLVDRIDPAPPRRLEPREL